MRIRFLGVHNLETKSTRMTSFIIDDRTVIDCGGLTSGLTLQQQHKVETILLTHRHYDHVRDLPIICLNTIHNERTIDIYGLPDTLESIETHLFDGGQYPDFRKTPSTHNPKIRLHPIRLMTTYTIAGYDIQPVLVPHGVPAIGYGITSETGQTVFVTGDCGRGLAQACNYLMPNILIADVTFPSSMEEAALKTGHLTPRLLQHELSIFHQANGFFPRVFTVHMNPTYRSTLLKELHDLGNTLNTEITPARENMVLDF